MDGPKYCHTFTWNKLEKDKYHMKSKKMIPVNLFTEQKDSQTSERIMVTTGEGRDFPGGTVGKKPAVSAGDMGSVPGFEDFTCRGTAKPVCHNYWVGAPRARMPRAVCPEPELSLQRSHCDEMPMRHSQEQPPLARTQQRRPSATKSKNMF